MNDPHGGGDVGDGGTCGIVGVGKSGQRASCALAAAGMARPSDGSQPESCVRQRLLHAVEATANKPLEPGGGGVEGGRVEGGEGERAAVVARAPRLGKLALTALGGPLNAEVSSP